MLNMILRPTRQDFTYQIQFHDWTEGEPAATTAAGSVVEVQAANWEEAFLWWLSEFNQEAYEAYKDIAVSVSIHGNAIDIWLDNYLIVMRDLTEFADTAPDCITCDSVIEERKQRKKLERQERKKKEEAPDLLAKYKAMLAQMEKQEAL